MSENQPPEPNVDTFNNLYWLASDTDELEKDISTLFTRTQKLSATTTSTTLSSANTTIQGSTQLLMSGNTINITTTLNDLTLNTPTNKSIIANSNALYVGSTTTDNPTTGLPSNIFMRNAFNTAWEVQSRAFTETLRASVFTSDAAVTSWNTMFQQPIVRITTNTGNVDILGRTTTLTPSFNYPTQSTVLDLGILMYNNGYTSYFNSSGQWIYNGLLTQRVCVQYDITFNSGQTGIKAFVCRILTSAPAGNSRRQGVRYNQVGGNPLNTSLYVSTGQFIFDIEALNTIKLETENHFSTSSDGASVTTDGRLTFYFIPYPYT